MEYQSTLYPEDVYLTLCFPIPSLQPVTCNLIITSVVMNSKCNRVLLAYFLLIVLYIFSYCKMKIMRLSWNQRLTELYYFLLVGCFAYFQLLQNENHYGISKCRWHCKSFRTSEESVGRRCVIFGLLYSRCLVSVSSLFLYVRLVTLNWCFM